MQIKREMAVEDLEKMQISVGIAEGRTPQDLAQGGLTSAVDPKVLIWNWKKLLCYPQMNSHNVIFDFDCN